MEKHLYLSELKHYIMKKIYVLLFAMIFGMTSFGQTNLDFESWSGSPATADGWSPLTAQDSMFQASGILAISGTYSLGVKNVYKDDIGGGDSLAGSWVYQDMNVVPDSIKMACAPAIFGTDTARVLIYTWNGGSPVQAFLIELHAGNTTIGQTYTLSFDLTGANPFDAISVDIYSSKTPSNYQTALVVDDIEIFEPSGVGISESNLEPIVAYPSPANELINFNLGNNDADLIKVLDLSGREIGVITVNQQVESFDVSTLQNGVYFYSVIKDNKTVKTDKFVVSK
jgi:hypothetical protein